jgi:limonene-1,2-epoxide hydrolase
MRRIALLVAVVALLVGCGGSEASPEEVVRAWSTALNADQNEAAADLFAPGAKVVQGGLELTFSAHKDAVAWNQSLPCNGQIVGLDVDGSVVTASFLLRDSQTTPCDAPGERVTAIFTVEEGKITRWEQPLEAPGPTV